VALLYTCIKTQIFLCYSHKWNLILGWSYTKSVVISLDNLAEKDITFLEVQTIITVYTCNYKKGFDRGLTNKSILLKKYSGTHKMHVYVPWLNMIKLKRSVLKAAYLHVLSLIHCILFGTHRARRNWNEKVINKKVINKITKLCTLNRELIFDTSPPKCVLYLAIIVSKYPC